MKKDSGFKLAYYRRIPAYFNEDTNELKGRSFFYDLLISINIFIDNEILRIDHFPILIEE